MSDICVLTTFFNPFNSQSRIKNFYIFLENLSKSISLDHFYALEITSSKQSQQIKDCKSLNVKNDNIIWQKEAGLNYLINNLNLSDYSKIITADCDVFFDDKDWINKTSGVLDKYHACQSFRSINYLSFNSVDIDSNVNGVVYGHLVKNKDAQYGNGGLVIGYNKEYIEYMRGFFDKSIVGGGDTLNILPFLYNCPLSLTLFDNLMIDVKIQYFKYLIKARNYLSENRNKDFCFFSDNNVNHLFHGSLKDRQYYTRYDYINKSNYYKNFEKDTNGLINYKEDSKLKDSIEEYFENRRENLNEKEPIVWCDVKNKVEEIDENKFMWLSDQNKFLFKNISEVKINFEKTEEINEVKLYNNDSIICLDFQNNISNVILNNPKKIEIFSDYFIPKIIGRNTDTRRLSIMIKKIEIKLENTDYFIDYPLEKIL